MKERGARINIIFNTANDEILLEPQGDEAINYLLDKFGPFRPFNGGKCQVPQKNSFRNFWIYRTDTGIIVIGNRENKKR